MSEPIIHQRFDPENGELSYYTYETLTHLLQELVAAHPQLATIESIGKSFEGRELWLVTLTNQATGSALEKPAYWIDGNTHAGEVTGSTVVLYTIWNYLTQYGKDPKITHVLDRSAIYLLPRISVDGAERYLTTPYDLRSSTRPYPYADERDGFYPEDIDGNDLILQMRFPNSNGAWVKSTQDSRIMRRREIDDEGGEYFSLLTEGLIRNYDGVSIPIAPPVEGLDINRNYPHFWEPEGTERGSGPYPFSEPETHAEAEFWSTHQNINGAVTYHTTSGVLLRPYGTHPDEYFPTDDLNVYKIIGEKGTELTGYPSVSVYHGFRYHPKEVMHGAMDDYAYDFRGWYAFTPELWDLPTTAGVGPRDFIAWIRFHPEEDDVKIMRWNDEVMHGEAFVDWKPFEHPQLGNVEIGGWKTKLYMENTPLKYLLEMCQTHSAWTLSNASLSPYLSISSLKVHALSEQTYHIVAVLENNGFLPTYTSLKALERKAVLPTEVELVVPSDVTVISGKQKQELAHLEGRSNKLFTWFSDNSPTDNRTKLEWVVSGKPNTQLDLVVRAQRAGTVHASIVLAQKD